MKLFSSEKVTNTITRIRAFSGEQMYLVEGTKKAVLVDTGTGVGDLRAYISTLTKLPVTVVVTHGHIDHAIGAARFNEVYMSFLDKAVYEERCTQKNRDLYLSSSLQYVDVEESDYFSIHPPVFFQDLKDGSIFDLGGITLETISCGGHSPGSMMILIQEERVLITGDACNYFTMLQGGTCLGLSAYENNLKAAKARIKERYETVYLSHGNVTAPVTLIDEVLAVIRDIKENRDDKILFEYMGIKGYVAKAYGKNGSSSYMRLDGGFGNIVYDPNRIWE